MWKKIPDAIDPLMIDDNVKDILTIKRDCSDLNRKKTFVRSVQMKT